MNFKKEHGASSLLLALVFLTASCTKDFKSIEECRFELPPAPPHITVTNPDGTCTGCLKQNSSNICLTENPRIFSDTASSSLKGFISSLDSILKQDHKKFILNNGEAWKSLEFNGRDLWGDLHAYLPQVWQLENSPVMQKARTACIKNNIEPMAGLLDTYANYLKNGSQAIPILCDEKISNELQE